jgi:formate dehydrogenase subunit gamma
MEFPSWSKEVAQELLAMTRDEPGPVLISLQTLQQHFGYIPLDAIALVADACNVSRADVHGVLTFYHGLHTKLIPPNTVRLCVAEACQAVGARELTKALEENGSVEIEKVYCFGNCALGPSAMVKGKLIGRATVKALIAAVEKGGD